MSYGDLCPLPRFLLAFTRRLLCCPFPSPPRFLTAKWNGLAVVWKAFALPFSSPFVLGTSLFPLPYWTCRYSQSVPPDFFAPFSLFCPKLFSSKGYFARFSFSFSFVSSLMVGGCDMDFFSLYSLFHFIFYKGRPVFPPSLAWLRPPSFLRNSSTITVPCPLAFPLTIKSWMYMWSSPFLLPFFPSLLVFCFRPEAFGFERGSTFLPFSPSLHLNGVQVLLFYGSFFPTLSPVRKYNYSCHHLSPA